MLTIEDFITLLDYEQISNFSDRLKELEERLSHVRNRLNAIVTLPTPNNWVHPPLTLSEKYDRLKKTQKIVGEYLRENPNLCCRPMKVVPTLFYDYYEPELIGEMKFLPEIIEKLKAEILKAMYYFTDVRIACEFLHPPLISDEHSVIKPILALENYAFEQLKLMRSAMLKLSNFWAERANARITMYEHAQCEVIQFYSLCFEQEFAENALLIVDTIYNSYVGLFMRIEKDYEDIVKFKKLRITNYSEILHFYQ